MKKTLKRLTFILIISSLLLGGCTTPSEGSNEEVVEESEKKEIASDSKVVTINGKTFNEDDLEFYTLINKVKIQLQVAESNDEDQRMYYEEQLEYYDNINVNLQSLIELYAMSLLAEEKNYFVPDEKLQDAVKKFNEQVENNEVSVSLIESYGREKYNRNIQEYVRQTILRDRIAKELEEEVLEEKPDAEEAEISYFLEDKFEELYAAQIATLDMEIHLQ